MGTARKFCLFVAMTVAFAGTVAKAQQSQAGPPRGQRPDNMPGMDMGNNSQDADQTREAAKSANDAMADHDMKMSAHMFMTDLRPHNAADEQRAAQTVEVLQQIDREIPRLQSCARGWFPHLYARFAAAALPLHQLRLRLRS